MEHQGWRALCAAGAGVVLLAACASSPAIPPGHTLGDALRLSRVTIVGGAYPNELESCTHSIQRAFQRHQVEPHKAGIPVEIDIVIWTTPVVEPPPGLDDRLIVRPHSRVEFTADLTALVHVAPRPITVWRSGSSEVMAVAGACEAASERLAAAIAKLLEGPSAPLFGRNDFER